MNPNTHTPDFTTVEYKKSQFQKYETKSSSSSEPIKSKESFQPKYETKTGGNPRFAVLHSSDNSTTYSGEAKPKYETKTGGNPRFAALQSSDNSTTYSGKSKYKTKTASETPSRFLVLQSDGNDVEKYDVKKQTTTKRHNYLKEEAEVEKRKYEERLEARSHMKFKPEEAKNVHGIEIFKETIDFEADIKNEELFPSLNIAKPTVTKSAWTKTVSN